MNDQAMPVMNEEPILSVERVRFGKQSQFNPIRNLNPERLAFELDQFEYGYLRNASLLWDKMERRDDVLQSVAPKRKKAVSRRPWKVMTKENSAEATKHKKTLDYFYNNLIATNGVDRNIKGGVRQLIYQMMDCKSKRYAVHHIVWKPSTAGLTAQLYFIPLWYFENLTGELRFLLQDYATEGEALDPGSWLVATGEGLMEVCSVAYMLKHLPLKAWLFYCDKYAMPGTHGKTDAAPGTEAWRIMVQAVAGFGQNFSCVTGKSDTIEKIDMSADGRLPFPPLIERIDRAMSALWRGADLSSMSGHGGSKGGGQGASLQGQESDLLEADDCESISEMIQNLDKLVIAYTYGEDVAPLAYFAIDKPTQKDTGLDLQVDTFLLDGGFPLALDDIAERYDRRLPDPDEVLMTPPQQPIQTPVDPAMNARTAPTPFGQAKLLGTIRKHINAANLKAWQPILSRLQALDEAPDDQYDAMGRALITDLPELLKDTDADAPAIKAWTDSISATIGNGLTSAR